MQSDRGISRGFFFFFWSPNDQRRKLRFTEIKVACSRLHECWGAEEGFEPRAGSQSPKPWFLTTHTCTAATVLQFMEHIVLGLLSVSPSLSPSLSGVQLRNSSGTALPTQTKTNCLHVWLPSWTGIAWRPRQCCSPPHPTPAPQSLHSQHRAWHTEGAPNNFQGWNEVFLMLWGVRCMVFRDVGWARVGQNSLHGLCRFSDMLACSQMLKNTSRLEAKQRCRIISGSQLVPPLPSPFLTCPVLQLTSWSLH